MFLSSSSGDFSAIISIILFIPFCLFLLGDLLCTCWYTGQCAAMSLAVFIFSSIFIFSTLQTG